MDGVSGAKAATMETQAGPVGSPIPEAALPDTLLGVRVGGYRIVKEIGCGGMGVVYLAEHTQIGSQVAVKVLKQELRDFPEIARRFVDEARAVATIRHHHTVQIYDLTTLPDGRPCIVMEYVEGETLEERAARGKLDVATAMPILLQLCDALGAAHAHGIVHRDIKAENVVLMRRNGQSDFVKLLDFGIARMNHSTPGLTIPGMVLGTPYYMSPEQVTGEAVDPRSDVYSLGVLAFRILTGALPFEGTSAMEVMMMHLHTPTPEATGVGSGLRRVLLKAMSKRREDRFRDALELEQALRAVAGGGTFPPDPAALRPTEPSLPIPAAAVAPGGPFTVSVEGRKVRLRFQSEETFRALEKSELAHGRIYIPSQETVPEGPLTLVLEVPDRPRMEIPAELAMRLGPSQASRWSLQPGFALALPKSGIHAPVSAADVPDRAGIDALLLRLGTRSAENPYGFLQVAEDADAATVRAACRKLEAELIRAREGATAPQRERLASLQARLERTQKIVCDPEQRASFDALAGNYRGVARCVAAGLSLTRIEDLRREYARQRPERLRQARPFLVSADVHLRDGHPLAAIEALERALALDPLSMDLQRRYWGLKRTLLSTTPMQADRVHFARSVGEVHPVRGGALR